MAKRRSKTKQTPAWVGPTVGVSIIGILAVALTWYWLSGLALEKISIVGEQHATAITLQHIARIPQDTLLFDIDPQVVQERILQHPWVQEAVVRRLPPGTLSIHVAERTPVALVLNVRGAPAYYLDREGYQMPVDTMDAHNVPLVRGVKGPVKTAQPVENKSLLALLKTLDTVDEQTDALLSEFDLLPSGDVDLYTAPAPNRGPIRVRLGQGGYSEKLARLQAFWHQAILPQSSTRFEWIDLRFDGQIVTREKA